MTAYLVTQAINISILVGFALILAAVTRAQIRRKLEAISAAPVDPVAREQLKEELRNKIAVLQRELEELDRAERSPLSTAI
jgi:predicted nucleotidyltransferase